MAGNLLVTGKKSAIKNVFGNYRLKRRTKERAGYLYYISRHFIALGMYITINEQGVIKEC